MARYFTDTLEHHGVKGQKWGVRSYQNEDGSLTSEGQNRYRKKERTAHRLVTAGSAASTAGVLGFIGSVAAGAALGPAVTSVALGAFAVSVIGMGVSASGVAMRASNEYEMGHRYAEDMSIAQRNTRVADLNNTKYINPYVQDVRVRR